MHLVVVFLEAKREHVASLRAALMLHARTCLEKESGCRRYEIGTDTVDGSSFLLYQIYDDAAAYMAHKELPHVAEFRVKIENWTAARRLLTYELIDGIGLA